MLQAHAAAATHAYALQQQVREALPTARLLASHLPAGSGARAALEAAAAEAPPWCLPPGRLSDSKALLLLALQGTGSARRCISGESKLLLHCCSL